MRLTSWENTVVLCDVYEADLLKEIALYLNIMRKTLLIQWCFLYDGYEVDFMEKCSILCEYLSYRCKFKYHKIEPIMHGPSDYYDL